MADNSELEFRSFSSADIGSLAETFELCFNTKAGDDYFRWKYFDNPVGEVVAFVAAHGNTIAGFYGVIPELYTVNGEVKKIYQSMDTMTHPNYQRRGLFVKLANMTYDRVREIEGEIKVTGIGGNQSHFGLINKLAWKDVHEFKYFFTNKYLFKAARFLKRRASVKMVKTVAMNEGLVNYLNSRQLSSKPLQPHISPKFFEWRVFKNLSREFHAVEIKSDELTIGVCAYVLDEKRRCLIHFLSFAEENMISEYTGDVIDFLFKETGSQFVFTWEPLDTRMHKAMQKCGFVKNPREQGPFSYRIPFVVRVEPETSGNTSWLDINNYDIQPLMQD